jgi:hypothetical protein
VARNPGPAQYCWTISAWISAALLNLTIDGIAKKIGELVLTKNKSLFFIYFPINPLTFSQERKKGRRSPTFLHKIKSMEPGFDAVDFAFDLPTP